MCLRTKTQVVLRVSTVTWMRGEHTWVGAVGGYSTSAADVAAIVPDRTTSYYVVMGQGPQRQGC